MRLRLRSRSVLIVGFATIVGNLLVFIVAPNIHDVSPIFLAKKNLHDLVVSITVQKIDNDEVIVNIKYNGTGIDLQILPKLFTKFATKSQAGTGLGMFVAKNIIEAHVGKMWAKNNPDGIVATFTFTLPISLQQGK